MLTFWKGQSTLPSSCPVCEHTPVAAEDCKPHKSLRTTIKVFLRTEEKKREALRQKEEFDNSPSGTPENAGSGQIDEVPPPNPEPEAEGVTDIPEAKAEEAPDDGNHASAGQAVPSDHEDEAQQAQHDIEPSSAEVRFPFRRWVCE